MSDHDKSMPLERLKRIVRENIDSCRPLRDFARMTVVAVKRHLDDGTVMSTRERFTGIQAPPSVQGLMRQWLVRFVEGVDVRCLDELLELCPKGRDNRIPAWVYGPVDAYLDDDSAWVLVPRRVA